MNLAALILVTLLGGISIYDFYALKKSKVRTLTCLSSAGITLVVNAVLFIIGLMIGSAIFGEDQEHEKGNHYFVFWLNHNNESRSTRVSHKELFDWFKIDQVEFDKKFRKYSDLEEQLAG